MTPDDERLDRAVRAALHDLVEAAPTRDDVPVRTGHVPGITRTPRRPLLVAAAGLTAAAGIVAIVAVTTRDPITPDVAEQSAPVTQATSVPPSTPPTAPSTAPTTTQATTTTLPAAPMPGPPQRVFFESGSNNATIPNEIGPERTDRYVLEAAAGQTMVVSLETTDPTTTFAVFAPDGAVLAEGEVVDDVDLPADGDYLIEVLTTGSGGDYTITFLID